MEDRFVDLDGFRGFDLLDEANASRTWSRSRNESPISQWRRRKSAGSYSTLPDSVAVSTHPGYAGFYRAERGRDLHRPSQCRLQLGVELHGGRRTSVASRRGRLAGTAQSSFESSAVDCRLPQA